MILLSLSLRDFRSYPSLSLDFDPKLNVIEGPNGEGKTNLVEAIYYLSLARSWRSSVAIPLIRSGADDALIEARLAEGNLRRDVGILITPGGRQENLNGKPLRRQSELSRLVNVILFAPEDTALFKGPPSERRNFLDVSLAKQSLDYLSLLGKYDRLLVERNAALKKDRPSRPYLEVLTEELIAVSEPIARDRRLYLQELTKALRELTGALYGSPRDARLVYHPFIKEEAWKEAAKKAYTKTLETDILHKGTSLGIHREDYSLVLEGKDVALYGSEAENRLAALALKLAPAFLVEDEGRKPLVILDDVYSELDAAHAANLTRLLPRLGQCFVTAAALALPEATHITVQNHQALRRT